MIGNKPSGDGGNGEKNEMNAELVVRVTGRPWLREIGQWRMSLPLLKGSDRAGDGTGDEPGHQQSRVSWCVVVERVRSKSREQR